MSRKREFLAWALTATLVLLLMSLLSYDPGDLQRFPRPDPPANWCGKVGAHTAGALYGLLGSSALLLAGFWVFWCARWGLSDHLERRWQVDHATLAVRLAGSTVFAVACSGMEALPRSLTHPVLWNTNIPAGGYLGHYLAAEARPGHPDGVLRDLLNTGGTFGVLGLILVLSFILATNLSVLAMLLPVAKGTRERIAAWVDRRFAPAAAIKPKPAPPPPEAPAPATPPVRAAVATEPPRPPPAPKPIAIPEAVKPRPAPPPPPKPKQPPKSVFVPAPPGDTPYILPPMDLLEAGSPSGGPDPLTEERKMVLVRVLGEFGVDSKVVNVEEGPVITQYELELAPGIKVNKIGSLANDIAMALKSTTVRVVAPLPGKSTVGVEVPKSERGIVRLRELLQGADSRAQAVPFLIGKDVSGQPLIADITEMPHMLIAGTTGSGKTVCLNSLILSLLMTRSPQEVELLMVDPKTVELAGYKDIPHLISPIVTDMKKASGILDWAVDQMEERYDLLARVGVRHISQYNALGRAGVRARLGPEASENTIRFPLPYTVILVDEYADLMLVAAKEVEAAIQRLVQKSRAVGIHVVLATQRPSVDVITGVIKANVPVRIAFQVASKVDSRTILDASGADLLLGRGDMLYRPPGSGKTLRVQGAFVSDEELARVVSHVKSQGKPNYRQDLLQWKGASEEGQERDDLYKQAVRLVLETKRGSVSLLQRHFDIGYTRAARLVDLMSEDGIVGEYKGSVAREVLITLEDWDRAHPEDARERPAETGDEEIDEEPASPANG